MDVVKPQVFIIRDEGDLVIDIYPPGSIEVHDLDLDDILTSNNVQTNQMLHSTIALVSLWPDCEAKRRTLTAMQEELEYQEYAKAGEL